MLLQKKTYIILVAPLLLFGLLFTLGQGCSVGFEPVSDESSNSSNYVSGCVMPESVSRSPKTIEEVVNLINASPKPLSVPCFLESLQRPLKVTLTNNPSSAQPAVGERSPRVFILSGKLFISVVPEGLGSELVELSFQTAVDRTIKAEIAFPVVGEITQQAPFDRIQFNGGTACVGCHTNEQPASEISYANAFSSKAFQPIKSTIVSLSKFKSELSICNNVLEPKRCSMLRALFNHGEVQSQDFPFDMPFIF